MQHYRVWNFAIVGSDTGQVLARAIVCPGAHYVALHWMGTDRLDRREVSPLVWRAVVDQLNYGLEPGTLPRVTAMSALLAGSRASVVSVRFLASERLGIDPPEAVAGILDARLRHDAVSRPALALLEQALQNVTD
jgi:hypothetical protein